jgi:2-polyprenyl-3-methyl-5-hydroxy-6-metoxy-1,4-benzoquinol methylase
VVAGRQQIILQSTTLELRSAVDELLREASGNKWFLDSYWPENKPRVLAMLADAFKYVDRRPLRVFEPGCGTGYISTIASRIGCTVTACDAWKLPERDATFAKLGVKYFDTNFNTPAPFPDTEDNSFDVILFGEVFEHLLFHPVGMLRELHRLLVPGGILILTTPNPSTLANAVRVLLGKHTLWGTPEFMQTPKFEVEESGQTTVIDMGEIHYREYLQRELVGAFRATGFEIAKASYVGTGNSAAQSLLKRTTKSLLGSMGMHNRLFASSNYLIGRK